MAAASYRHLVIFLPGIMGSVLQKDGKDAWALSGQAIWQYLRTMGGSLAELAVTDTDYTVPDLGDGVVATRLISDIYSVPYLIDGAGYGPIRRRIRETLGVVEGSILAPRDNANFYPFPYDWRRDVRASALRLQKFIDAQLPKWRATSADAQVVLLAHSLGGLVARYYLECLEGWRSTRALLTFGTPHRGSFNAVKVLDQGMETRLLGITLANLTNVVRALTSVYQLLPTYPAVQIGTEYRRVTEIGGFLNIEQDRAVSARNDLHEAILTAAKSNKGLTGYTQKTIPIVGARNETLQSARLLPDNHLELRYEAPPGLPEEYLDGDGTVPSISAIPADLEGLLYERFGFEKHGWLTNNKVVREPALQLVRTLGSRQTTDFHGSKMERCAALSMLVHPLHSAGAEVPVRLRLRDAGEGPARLELVVTSVGTPSATSRHLVQTESDAPVTALLPPLTPGLYAIEVRTQVDSLSGPTPVHGVFEVVPTVDAGGS
jgi:hypothetical protein